MPIPVASSGYLTSISAELNQMATLVHAITTLQGAPQPAPDLSTICASLGAINSTLVASNNAKKMTTQQRHDIGNQFQVIAAEMLKP